MFEVNVESDTFFYTEATQVLSMKQFSEVVIQGF